MGLYKDGSKYCKTSSKVVKSNQELVSLACKVQTEKGEVAHMLL
jgi:hypothetical protein